MSHLTWLHLSDLHACNPRTGWDAARVTETLVEDLKRLQQDHDLRPDWIFFTGDAAFGDIGTKKAEKVVGQLKIAGDFLDAVRCAFNPPIERENLFLVPGNHDVCRGEATPEQAAWLDQQGSIAPVQGMIQAGAKQWQRYMERLKIYRKFLQDAGLKHLLQDPQRLIYATVREVRGLRVGIAGFNTAWSCCAGDKKGQLWMAGKWQQGTLRQQLAGADFSIALLHHPPDWLGEYETPDFGRGLEQDFRFLLHGHEHRAWVLATQSGYAVIAAGACYESSESENNGYNVVRLDLAAGRGEVWLRRFEASGGAWIPRYVPNQTDARGVWPLQIAPLATRSQRAAQSLPKASAGLVAAMPQSDLARYLQRLRAAHRDIKLAGFETKVRVPIQIQDVYIPLRARVRHVVSERDHQQFGTLREVEAAVGGGEEERELAFDQTLTFAQQHGFPGAVVLGDPGSGKSTLLKHFVLAATDPLIGPAALGLADPTIPVLIELGRLKDPSAGLKPAIAAAVAQADIALEGASFAQELLRQPLLVLVDGLDEVADPQQRAEVSRWLEQALTQLPESRFVVSSRYAGYKADARLDGRFLELHVRAVEEDDARRFIASWYQAVEAQAELGRDEQVAARIAEEARADLATKIFNPEDARTSSLCRLARNPMMLQILCLVHRDRPQLPERRVELYRECVLVLLELWRRAKGMPILLDAPQALVLLRPLAWHLHRTEGRREAALAELLPVLAEPLRALQRDPGDGAQLLEAIREQSGVLVSVGQGAYGFLHLSFQEYLAALHVQDRFASDPEMLGELAEKFGQPWWREVILLALGLGNPSVFAPLMQALLKRGVLQRDVALADHCLGDALVTSAVPFLQALAAGLADATERYHALRLLRALPGWQEEVVAGERGQDLIERLAKSEQDREVLGMMSELLGRAAPASFVSGQLRERENPQDGSVLVYVPGGEFVLGAEDISAKEQPIHRVRLSAYWIGKYPVNNAQYQRFLTANPSQRKPSSWDDPQFNQPEQPVVGVSWLDALAYCRWADLALPSEAQWEAAARGAAGRKYPWGNEDPSPELANYDGNHGRTTPVGAYPQGAGPFGTLDQAGNVWEWCRDLWVENAYRDRDGKTDPCASGNDRDEADESAWRVVRGGSWIYRSRFLRAAFRSRRLAWGRDRFVGFRVAAGGGSEHDF